MFYLTTLIFVCYSWNQIIGSSSLCTFKLNLKDDYSLCPRVLWEEKLTEILSMKRKFCAIECVSPLVSIYNNKEDLFTKVVKKHGENVTHLNIQFFHFDNFSNFVKVLNSLPKLETFVLNSCAMANKILDIEPIVLPKLKVLSFEGSDPTLLKGFKAINLKAFHVAKVDRNFVTVMNFLIACPELESIVCKDLCSFEIIFPYKIDRRKKNLVKYPFRLKTVKVYETYEELASHHVVVLFNSQGKFLQKLNLEVLINEVVLRKIYNFLRKLKCLSVNVLTEETYDEGFYNDFKPLYKLKSLNINCANEDCLRACLKNSPKLQELVAKDLCSLDMILEFSQNIRKLAVQSFDNPAMKFENLEEFSVESVVDLNSLIMFLSNNPKIKTLGISSFDKSHLKMLDDIMTQSNIHHFKIECSVKRGKEIYEKFRRNSRNLRSLNLLFYARVYDEFYFFRKKLIQKEVKLSFPKERENFEMKCEFFDNFVSDNDSNSEDEA